MAAAVKSTELVKGDVIRFLSDQVKRLTPWRPFLDDEPTRFKRELMQHLKGKFETETSVNSDLARQLCAACALARGDDFAGMQLFLRSGTGISGKWINPKTQNVKDFFGLVIEFDPKVFGVRGLREPKSYVQLMSQSWYSQLVDIVNASGAEKSIPPVEPMVPSKESQPFPADPVQSTADSVPENPVASVAAAVIPTEPVGLAQPPKSSGVAPVQTSASRSHSNFGTPVGNPLSAQSWPQFPDPALHPRTVLFFMQNLMNGHYASDSGSEADAPLIP